MKKRIIIIIVIGSFILLCLGIIKYLKDSKNSNNYVSYNGWLKVNEKNLVNSKNQKVQLYGVSSHGIQWYKDLYTYDNLKNLKENWGINTFRIAMYTEPKENGYIKFNDLKKDVITIVDYAIELDMYVIIDWHILKDNDPLKYKNEALDFFNEMSNKYKNKKNVIYEICNEPNGDISWEENVKPYAEEVIKIIRKNSKKSLIIVGIPDWCKDLDSVLKSPLEYDNIIYSVHFYAGTDGKSLKEAIDKFRKNDLSVFVSECGITNASGDGKMYKEEFREWINYLNEYNISWIFWSFSNKDETSSIIDDDYDMLQSSNLDFNDYLTETGEIVKDIFLQYKNRSNN